MGSSENNDLNPAGDNSMPLFKRPRENSKSENKTKNNSKNITSSSQGRLPRFIEKIYPKKQQQASKTVNSQQIRITDDPELWNKPEFQLVGEPLKNNACKPDFNYNQFSMKHQKNYMRFQDVVLKHDMKYNKDI